MKTDTCRLTRQELQSMLVEEENQELVTYAEQMKAKLLADWIGSKTESLRKELRYESALLTYIKRFIQELDESRYAILRLGALMGTVESFERILYEQNQTLWAEARFTKEPVKHLPEIVQALETHGPMSHTEISDYLGIKPSTLSEAMKKVLNTGAVQVGAIGKYKMYSLSDSGLRYGKELRKNRKRDISLAELCEKLNQLFQETKDKVERETIRSTIMGLLDDELSLNIYRGDIMQLRDSEHPQEILGRFEVDSFFNILDNSEKILSGHFEKDLNRVTNSRVNQRKLNLSPPQFYTEFIIESSKSCKERLA